MRICGSCFMRRLPTDDKLRERYAWYYKLKLCNSISAKSQHSLCTSNNLQPTSTQHLVHNTIQSRAITQFHLGSSHHPEPLKISRVCDHVLVQTGGQPGFEVSSDSRSCRRSRVYYCYHIPCIYAEFREFSDFRVRNKYIRNIEPPGDRFRRGDFQHHS